MQAAKAFVVADAVKQDDLQPKCTALVWGTSQKGHISSITILLLLSLHLYTVDLP